MIRAKVVRAAGIAALIAAGLGVGVTLSYVALAIVTAFCYLVIWGAAHPAALVCWVAASFAAAFVIAAFIRAGMGPPPAV